MYETPNPWDLRYGGEDYVYGRDPNDFLREMAGRIPPGPVLCLAEGEGRNAVFLAGRGHRVTAVDASVMGIEKTRRLANDRGVEVEVIHADLAGFSIAPGVWAGVVSIFAHLPPPLRRRLHREIVTGLQPGGIFILEGHTPAQLSLGTGGPPVTELMMELDVLQRELDGLDWIVAREVEREIQEGTLHVGRSAVVQLAGVRPAARSAEG